ncbi:hypothetical protein HETIRDRAFT_421100 [Heterobasidion irregulare TC 32-1]|uniref:Uncharacterized protein n=1 Tax=Heterobasidion irregulare (strain TC 32-1) TaxID=747525 RepID=W4JXS2_HETIT|nr:uncharacterized protein HETIRDRAFT_421100 [Heterobasidion irregulare TC 32-1]ETW78367.1 hypothetical protein HETIRDRAFT_421100 [Heterobasidion irregulare TC 32-1]
MDPNGSEWIQMDSNGFKWIQKGPVFIFRKKNPPANVKINLNLCQSIPLDLPIKSLKFKRETDSIPFI